MDFSKNKLTNLTICGLIILGGLGFVVIKDLFENLKNRLSNKRPILKIQTRIVLISTVLLILIGAAGIYFFEKNNVLSTLSLEEKVSLSLFQSITSRTAGFNTCDISRLSSAALFLIIMLMFIGACPGSTGGGIKTTTLSVLWATVLSGFRQKENVELYKRTIPQEVTQKAVTVLITSFVIICIFVSLLLYLERQIFLDIFFETVSAFGTVGLSTGITPRLSPKGKLLITMLMFIGRLGPLTIGYAFIRHRKSIKYTYPEERIMIG
jgi:trk system potassium uptake protein TrkH